MVIDGDIRPYLMVITIMVIPQSNRFYIHSGHSKNRWLSEEISQAIATWHNHGIAWHKRCAKLRRPPKWPTWNRSPHPPWPEWLSHHRIFPTIFHTGWWLTYPSEKYESVGMITFPTWWEKWKIHVPNNQRFSIAFDRFSIAFDRRFYPLVI